MRCILYVVILTLLLFVPVESLDIAMLEPVQTVAVRMDEGYVILETDTKNKGQGKNLQVAINDLKENTPGVIYLDTAEYLLVTEETVSYTKELEGYLQPSVKVSIWDGAGNVEKAAKYLEVRRDLPTLQRWNKEKWNPVEKS